VSIRPPDPASARRLPPPAAAPGAAVPRHGAADTSPAAALPAEAARAAAAAGPDAADTSLSTFHDTMIRAQVVLPGMPRVEAAERAWAIREARLARAQGDITVGGRKIPRLAPAPTSLSSLGQKTIDTFFKIALAPRPQELGFEDWRSARAAREVLAMPPVPGPDGEPKPLGGLTIVRPGLGNLRPSAAQVFRAAQHSDKLVVAYPNPYHPRRNALRPAAEIDGVPVPPELEGKIFVIGSPDHHLISYRQSSDVFLEQLEAMHKSRKLLGVDVLESGATVLAHSQGCLDTALTRKRLEEAGLGGAIGHLVAVAAPFKGSAFAEELLGTVAGSLALVVDNDDALRAVRSLDPDEVAKDFGPDEQRFVDLSLAGVVGPRPSVRPRAGFPPFEVRGHNNIRLTLRALAGGMTLADFATGKGPRFFNLVDILRRGSHQSDGLVSKDSADYGKRAEALAQPYDHAGIFEDPGVVDEILRRL
jgi:hypothetical protein